jgi:hypothetical protein
VSSRLLVAIIWAVSLVTTMAAVYESWALATEGITISRYLRTLAEAYHPVYFFAGAILTVLILIVLRGNDLPPFIRALILAWLVVFGHIFWGF